MGRKRWSCPNCGHNVAAVMRDYPRAQCPGCDLTLIRAEDGPSRLFQDVASVMVVTAIVATILAVLVAIWYAVDVVQINDYFGFMFLLLLWAPTVGVIAGVLAGAGYGIYRNLKRRRIKLADTCPECKYDLRSDLAAGCPECGWHRPPHPGAGAESLP